METIELFYPDISVTIGKYNFTKGIEVEVYSSKTSYFDWAKIRFTKQFQNEISINNKENAMIELGYNYVLNEVFKGYVSKPYNKSISVHEILLKDHMILLEETYITNTFIDAAPQEIISFCLAKAGVTNFKLSNKMYPQKKSVPVNKKNIIDVINQVHAVWDITERFFFSDGVFYWGEKPPQKKIYTFEYGVNIISLNRSAGVWELETVSAPFIKHSHKINVDHPQISGEFEVEKVVFVTNETGFIRTRIYF